MAENSEQSMTSTIRLLNAKSDEGMKDVEEEMKNKEKEDPGKETAKKEENKKEERESEKEKKLDSELEEELEKTKKESGQEDQKSNHDEEKADSKQSVEVNGDNEDKQIFEHKTDTNKEIHRILSEYDDIYIKEYLINELNIDEHYEIDNETAELMKQYIEDYTKEEHYIDTKFTNSILSALRFIDMKSDDHIVANKVIECVALLDTKYEYTVHYRRILGYSKIYKSIKDVIASMFDRNKFIKTAFSYRYIGYLITLLDNDQLVYKNLKPLLTTLINYVKNDVVENNIEACATLTSSVVDGAPTLFTNKLASCLISYYTKILFNSKNYINYKLDTVVKTTEMLLELYEVEKSLALGLLRESIALLVEFRNTSIKEEIEMINNITRLMSGIYAIYNDVNDEITDYKKYLNPKFATEAGSTTETFLCYKYRYLDKLLGKFNCYDRIELINDLTNSEDPGAIVAHFKNYNEYVVWDDLVGVKKTMGMLRYLFDEYFIRNRTKNHQALITLFFGFLHEEQAVYFTKFASEKNCHFITIKIFIRYSGSNKYEHMKMRQMILSSINEIETGDEITEVLKYTKENKDEYKKEEENNSGEKSETDESSGNDLNNHYKNMLMLFVVICSKMKPVQYKTDEYQNVQSEQIDLYKSVISKYITSENEHADYYVATLIYLDKQINRSFYSYFDVVQELMAIQIRKKKDELDNFKNRTFPLMFQMTHKEVDEIGMLFCNFNDSRFVAKYKEILVLFQAKESIDTSTVSENIEYEMESSSTIESGISVETVIDHEKEFLARQKQFITDRYELAEREMDLEQEKYDLAKKEHELLEEATDKYSKEQRKLIKMKYKEAKKALDEMNKKYERIKTEKIELEKNAKKEKPGISSILENNLKKAQSEHEKAKEEYRKSKKRYKEGNEKYKEALRDLKDMKVKVETKETVEKKEYEKTEYEKDSEKVKLEEFREGKKENKTDLDNSNSEEYKNDYSPLIDKPELNGK
ncbi:hypothetical protein ECANGB1_1715 [Enterospora canceri]|uniref:Uncharacterized protein n=1 Tax=Enterospora canceri TaxID=1081671 RepID=A0A1Y1SAG4_9MICR|nr:hypothetical protein ECANGB1_1715 [Enterospora canceri]